MTYRTTPSSVAAPAAPAALPSKRILIINPNTSQNMTSALEPAVNSLGYQHQNISFHYFTCPTTGTDAGIPSINSSSDASASAQACLPHLTPIVNRFDAFLVACYSQHPLVQLLKAKCEALAHDEHAIGHVPRRRYVTGIFEASVNASLSVAGSCGPSAGFGIVSTGKVWEKALASAVEMFLGGTGLRRFVGCETTGLNASELHDMPADQVRVAMMQATRRLVAAGKQRGIDVRAVCLGCAGMVGLEEAVRAALVESLGPDEARNVAVVDGVKAGVGELVSLCRGGF